MPGEKTPVTFPSARHHLPRAEMAALAAALLRRHPDPLFALLDAARSPQVRGLLLVADVASQSLYEGQQGEDLADFAPYLVGLPPADPFLDLLLREGWGQSWGVFLTSRQSFAEVRKHCRRFLMVETEGDEQSYFRFYDPRVLRTFLRALNADETATFFEGVTSFLLEANDPEVMLRFTPGEAGPKLDAISFRPCLDAETDLPWSRGLLQSYPDLEGEERLDLLRRWKEALVELDLLP